jgi:dienelactone hydrolase
MSSTLPAPAPGPGPAPAPADTDDATTPAPRAPRARHGCGRLEMVLFRVALAVLAVHVLDDNYLQPQPGTSPGDHVASGLVPLTLLGLFAWAYPRLSGGRRGAVALASGLLGIAAGIEGYYYARQVGPSGDDFTGLAAIPAGVLLLGLGTVTLWRTRNTSARPALRYGRRALLGIAGLFIGALVAIAGYGYVTTHVGRAVVPPDRLGVAHEDVTFRTSDGLELEGWYIPSRNGAAVIAFPGRKGPQAKARVLARHGYGVLLFDRRGEGRSDGDPNAWGWGGDTDVKAAIDYLRTRPDVDPRRIGGIGLSVGGEMMIEAAADTQELTAIVSEGAGARSTTEDMDQDDPALVKWTLGLALSAVKTAAVAVSSNRAPPANLKDLAANVEQPMLLIAAPKAPTGEALNRGYAKAAGESATLWEIPESSHVGGMTARPHEYERRVIGFFDRALAR